LLSRILPQERQTNSLDWSEYPKAKTADPKQFVGSKSDADSKNRDAGPTARCGKPLASLWRLK
jgi:hypothetical protein